MSWPNWENNDFYFIKLLMHLTLNVWRYYTFYYFIHIIDYWGEVCGTTYKIKEKREREDKRERENRRERDNRSLIC